MCTLNCTYKLYIYNYTYKLHIHINGNGKRIKLCTYNCTHELYMHIYTYVCIIYTYNYTYNSNLLNSDNKAGNVIKVHIFCPIFIFVVESLSIVPLLLCSSIVTQGFRRFNVLLDHFLTRNLILLK